MTREDLLALAAPLAARLATLDPNEPAAAAQAAGGFAVSELEKALRAAHAEGWLTPKEAGGVRFGRLTRASPEVSGFSIDVVDMAAAAEGLHTHPTGEFDLCFVLEGAPRFDGHGPGWVVYPPGSRHCPTVTGGRMLIVYFLPGGEIRFDKSS